MEYYDYMSYLYPSWSLEEIRSLSFRERNMWLQKGAAKLTRGV